MASVLPETPFNAYTGNGVATVYPYTFTLLTATDLVVTVGAVVVPASDFTLSGVGAQGGGNVTFNTAPINASAVLLARELPLERDTDYQYNGDLREDTLDRDFNRIWQVLQGYSSRLFGALRAPFPEQLNELPSASTRALRILGFDGAGQPIVLTPTDGTATDVELRLADPDEGAAMIARASQVVTSIASLRLLDETSPSQFAFVAGYRAAGDGGGGTYYLDAADTTSADNGGTIIVAADGARWKLARYGFVTLEHFGAYGNGTTSDGTPANQACKWCFETGDTLRLKGKHYAGARLEVHGSFNIEGGGATVEYLGIGYTLIGGTGSGTAALPTAWPLDVGIYNASAYLPVLYPITGAVAVGAQSLSVGSSTGIAVGDLVFICDSATSASSPTGFGNYIPRDFEYARVLTVAPTLITFVGRLQNAYSTTGVIVKCPGIATNCDVSNLKLRSPADAYQHVVRSAYGVKLRNIEMAGQPAAGAATFSDMLEYDGIKIAGTYGPMSTARGCVNVSFEDIEWQPMTGTVGEDCCIFIEESFYSITLKNIRGVGGYFSVRQANQNGAIAKRQISVSDSTFDTTNASAGATSPLQIGDMTGASMMFSAVDFKGAVVTPNPSSYPSITGNCLIWAAANASTDMIKFSACHFQASGAGVLFPATVGGLQGRVLFDAMCTFTTVSPALPKYKASQAVVVEESASSAHTLADTTTSLICNRASTVTVTLPSAATNIGRSIYIRTVTAQAVVSAGSNVVPLAGGAAGTAILAATAGKWAQLQADGTSWQIMAGN